MTAHRYYETTTLSLDLLINHSLRQKLARTDYNKNIMQDIIKD